MSDALPTLVVVLGVVSGGIVLVAARAPREALSCLMDFLLAAGLVRLAGEPTWTALATAAAILVVRQLAGRGMDAATAARARMSLRTPAESRH